MKRKAYQVTFTGPQPLAAEAGRLPQRVQVLQWGENPNVTGRRVKVGEKLVQQVAHPLYAWRRVALDFEHNTLEGTVAFRTSQEPRKVAGYGEIEVVPGRGVYLKDIKYTAEGLAAAEHYAAVSASPVLDEAGHVVAILSVAMCRNGAVPGMEFKSVPLAAGAAAQLELMNPAPEQSSMNYKEKLCRILGLDPETATEEEIAAAIEKRKAAAEEAAQKAAEAAAAAEATGAAAEEAAQKAAEAAAAAEATGAAAEEAAQKAAEVAEAEPPEKAETVALSAQIAALNKRLDAMQSGQAQRDKALLLEQARRVGKVVPLGADAVAALSLAQLQDVIKQTPVTVPLSALTPERLDDPGLASGPTEAQREIARNCGVDAAKVWPGKRGGISIRMALAILALSAGLGFVAVAVAQERNTAMSAGNFVALTAAETMHAGEIAGVASNGKAYQANNQNKVTVLGRVEKAAVSNETVLLRRGVFLLDNGDGSIAKKDIGQPCYAWTNTAYTAMLTPPPAGVTNRLGRVMNVIDDGVLVRIGYD